jgi:hypothetical protein
MTLDGIKRALHDVMAEWWNREIGTDTTVFLNPNRRRVKLQTLLTDLTLRVADLLRDAHSDRLHRIATLTFRDFPHPPPQRLPTAPFAAYELGFRAALEAVRRIAKGEAEAEEVGRS